MPFIVGPIGWRGVFFLGIIPAVLLFYIRLKAQEPERRLKTKRELGPKLSMGKSLSLTAIFFVIGLLLLPLAREGRRRLAPE